MKKATKTLITFFLILLVLFPAFFFLLYPNLNEINLLKESFDIYTISKESTIKTLTLIAPRKDTFAVQVLGYTSIEESLDENSIILEQKELEERNTKLTIESLNVEGNIYQGKSSTTMDQGFWHFPTSIFPGEKGNVVVIGHRFMHLPPYKDTFYNLDQINIGKEIVISDNYGQFTYIVIETKEVEPNDMSVLNQTDDYQLTLITCTPLWTSQKRLVVIAKLDKLYKKV